jgi:DNA-binding GntR family transcriptional regulator
MIRDLPDGDPTAYRYMQIADHIGALIESGQLKPGDRIPSELALASQFHVARGTVRKGILVLSRRGLVVTVPHKGSYVRPAPPN